MTSEFTPPPARRPGSATQAPQPSRPAQPAQPTRATAPTTVFVPAEEAAAEAMANSGQTYVVESKWCGWGGGWGSESDIARIMNRRAAQGYRLVATESKRCWCLVLLLVPVWRVKLLMMFERVR